MEEVLEEEVAELRDWLLTRVGDENDIVVDELQQEWVEGGEEEDDGESFPGSEEFREEVPKIRQKVEELKQRGCKEGR